jgi:NADH-quinone oxidoreductase subunit L
VWAAETNRDDVVDLLYDGIARIAELIYRVLSATETGQVRRYALGIALGAVVTIAITVIL